MELANIITIILAGFVNLGLIIGVYVKMRLKINSLEIKVSVLAKDWESLDQKLGKIFEKLEEINIALQNKVDR